MKATDRASRALLAILALVAMTWFLRATYIVSMPLAAAVFVSAVAWPVYRAMRRALPKWAALPMTMLCVAVVAATFFGAIVSAVALAAQRVPEYLSAVHELWTTATEWAGARGMKLEGFEVGKPGEPPPRWLTYLVTSGLTSLWALLGFLVLVFFFTALMLMEARRWADKTRTALDDGLAWDVIDATRTVARKVRSYFVTQTLVSLLSGVVEGLFVWAVGVPMPYVWALLFFLLNYIPNIGSTVAIVPPALLALVTMGWGWALVVLGGFVVFETLIGYVVQPLWQGKNLALSPLVVLLSIVFWGWVWGVVGAILAVPMTTAILIGCAHADALRPLALLLSDSASERELDRQTTSVGVKQ